MKSKEKFFHLYDNLLTFPPIQTNNFNNDKTDYFKSKIQIFVFLPSLIYIFMFMSFAIYPLFRSEPIDSEVFTTNFSMSKSFGNLPFPTNDTTR